MNLQKLKLHIKRIRSQNWLFNNPQGELSLNWLDMENREKLQKSHERVKIKIHTGLKYACKYIWAKVTNVQDYLEAMNA